MNITNLTIFISLILALSIASERLVEIIKGLIPPLNSKRESDISEGRRKAILHIMAVGAGILSAFIASWSMPENEFLQGGLRIFGIGLLVSGGSGFWNSVLTYFLNIKDLKAEQVKNEQSRKTTAGQVNERLERKLEKILELTERKIV